MREQISGEMWEAINKLFLLVRSANRRAVSRGPHAFFEDLRNGAHLFQGTADATMTHGEPYEFIRLGLQPGAGGHDGSDRRVPVSGRGRARRRRPGPARQLIALLRSCSAFEAFVERHGTLVRADRDRGVAVRSARLPAVVRSCLSSSLDAVTRIAQRPGRAAPHARSAASPSSSTARRATSRARAMTRDVRGLLAGIHARRRSGDEGVSSRAARPSAALAMQEAAAAAMWLTVEHVTRFSYDGPINEAYTEIRLKPAHRDGQRCSSFVARDRATRRLGRRVPSTASATPCTTSTCSSRTDAGRDRRSEVWTPEAFVDDERSRHRSTARPPAPEPLRRRSTASIAALAAHVDAGPAPRSPRRPRLMHAVRGAMTYETGVDARATWPTRRSRPGTASARTSRT